jgi:site-specific recombinase XerD
MVAIYELSKINKSGKSEIKIRWRDTDYQERANPDIWVEREWFSYVVNTGKSPLTGKRTITSEMKEAKVYHEQKRIELKDLVDYVKESGINRKNKKEQGWVKACIDEYYKRGQYKKDTLLTYIDRFIAELPNKKIDKTGKSYTDGTIRNYKTFRNTIMAFAGHAKKTDWEFDDIDKKFYENFNDYLTLTKGFTKNTVGNMVKHFKTILQAAKEAGLYTNTIKIPKIAEEIDNIYLNVEELNKIQQLDLSASEHLSKYRDYFIIMCWTGVRVSDLSKVINAPVENDMITIIQQKTDVKVVIPVCHKITELLKKYRGTDLNITTKFNEYLRDIACRAGIKDEITISKTVAGKRVNKTVEKWNLVSSHTGRRSFATNAYIIGCPSITIRKITGHKSEVSFIRYIKLSEIEHAEKMKKFWNNII